MSDASQESEEIEVKHTKSDNYRLIPANGVSGGIQPQGELKMDFTYDHNYKTNSEYYSPESGMLTEIRMDGHLEREHQVGVTMGKSQAYETALWILTRILGENVTQQDVENAITPLTEGSNNK
jgi:hypothetical protein